jgi:hypothetical protein
MSDPGIMPAMPEAVRRRVTRLGWTLGLACLALTVAFIIIFSRNGFPKDPKEYKRLQQAREAAGAPPADQQRADANQGERSPDQPVRTPR